MTGPRVTARETRLKVSGSLRRTGLYLFAFCILVSTAGANIGLALVLMAALLNPRDVMTAVRYQPLFYLALGFLLFLVLRQGLLPVYPGGSLGDIVKWSYLTLFWLVGWALGDDERRWHRVVGVAFGGWLTRVALGFDWERVRLALSDGLAFGFAPQDGLGHGESSIAFALFTGVALLGWVLWRDRIVAFFPGGGGWARQLPWLAGLALLVQVLIVTNSRGAWLATLCGFLAVGAGRWLTGGRPHLNRTTLVLLSAVLVLGYLNADNLMARIGVGAPAYQAVLSGTPQYAPYAPTGYRVHMHLHGLRMFRERPWIGWGAGSSAWLMAGSPDPQLHLFHHFHSGYLEVLLQFGLAGALFFAATIAVMGLGLWGLFRYPTVSAQFGWLLLGGWVMVAVWNLFDVRFEHHDYRFFSLLLMGLLFAALRRGASSEVTCPSETRTPEVTHATGS